MRAITIDTETTGLDLCSGDSVFAVGAAIADFSNPKEVADNTEWLYWDWRVNPRTRKPTYDKESMKEITAVIDSADLLIFHHATFDIRGLDNLGVFKKKIPWEKVRDTSILRHLVDSQKPGGLKDLALIYLDEENKSEEDLNELIRSCKRKVKSAGIKGFTLGSVQEDKWLPGYFGISEPCKDYCLDDVAFTQALYLVFISVLEEEAEVHKTGFGIPAINFLQRETDLLPIIYDMEAKGAYVRKTEMAKYRKEVTQAYQKTERAIEAIALSKGVTSFNIRSGLQLGNLLYDTLQLPNPGRTAGTATKKGAYRTDAESLEKTRSLPETQRSTVKKRLLDLILENKKHQTSFNYAESYNRFTHQGYIRFSWNQVGTATTRFSSSRPNGQNISTQAEVPLRRLFGPPPGHSWYTFDYSQLEIRILSVASQDKNMLEAFRQEKDIHTDVASQMYKTPKEKVTKEMRKSAKAITFGIIYGLGLVKLEEKTGDPEIKARFYAAYPAVKKFSRRTITQARCHNFIHTLFGYRLYVDPQRPYSSIDLVIQGTAGNIAKEAMINLFSFFQEDGCGLQPRIVINVHDELVIQFSSISVKKPYLRAVVRQMMLPGKRFGIHTPVNVERVKRGWDTTVPIDIGRV